MVPHGLVRPCGAEKPGGSASSSLKDIIDGGLFFKPGADSLLECLLDVFADDEHEPAEPGAKGVEDGVIDNGFAVGSDGVNLFEAAVTAAHAGSENE